MLRSFGLLLNPLSPFLLTEKRRKAEYKCSMAAKKQIMESCRGCGLTFNCVCDSLPSLVADWDLVLLTHPNETRRETNTGQWLRKSLAQCQVFPSDVVSLWEPAHATVLHTIWWLLRHGPTVSPNLVDWKFACA